MNGTATIPANGEATILAETATVKNLSLTENKKRAIEARAKRIAEKEARAKRIAEKEARAKRIAEKEARAKRVAQEELARRNALEEVIKTIPIEELVVWRNNASARVTQADARKEECIKELYAIEKRTQSDVRWIRKLNNALNARTFGSRYIKGKRVRVNILKEVVGV